jgi:rubrerythrin
VKEESMDTFKASDVYEIAAQIESNGEKLYRHAVGVTDDPKMKELFTILADEEVKHLRLFEGMAKQVEHYKQPETYDGEYCSYVRSYAEGLVFTPEKMEKEMAKIKSAEDAIEFGIQREIESILYYLETRNFVPDNQKADVDRIIDEERKHYLKLVDLRRDAA